MHILVKNKKLKKNYLIIFFSLNLSTLLILYTFYDKFRYPIIFLISIIFFIIFSILLIIKNSKILTREKRIKYTAAMLLVGFLMAVFYMTGQATFGHLGPKNTFLFPPAGTMFTDFTGPVDVPYIVTYSFFTTLIKHFLLLIGTKISLTLFLVGSVIFLTIINIKEIGNEKLNKSSIIYIVIFSLLSYPVLFSINRGNVEILVFCLLYLFTYYLNKKNFITSAIFLSLAISTKLFPVVYLIVLLSYKKFKAVIYACLLTFFLNLTSLIIISKTLSKGIYKIITDYLNVYTDYYIKEYAIKNNGLYFGHSLYGLLKLRIFSFYKSTKVTGIVLKKVTDLFSVYTRIEIIIFVMLSSYVIFVEKELWKKITLMVIAMNLLPYVSADYKLINFFIPLYFFINKKGGNRTDLLYIILFSLLLIPKNYYTTLLNLPNISLSILLNPILMILLALLIMFEGLKKIYVKNYSQ